MITTLKTTWGGLFCGLLLWLMLPVSALAADLAVVFEATPLFSSANIVPGDSVSRTIEVSNTGTETEALLLSVANTFSSGLSEVMLLTVTSGSDSFFEGTFVEFFTATPVPLGDIADSSSRTYTLTASLPSGIGNEYQLETLGFDLVIGFEGGETVTDGEPERSSGGGGGGGSFDLFNERVVAVEPSTGSATVTWNTNRNSSSYLICGNLEDGPFSLSTNPPLFGYVFSVPEEDTDTVSHSMTLTDLALGSYECRPASREESIDDFTVGRVVEFDFTSNFVPVGSVLGVGTTSGVDVVPMPDVKGAQVSLLPDGGLNLGFGYVPYRTLVPVGVGLLLVVILLVYLRRFVRRS